MAMHIDEIKKVNFFLQPSSCNKSSFTNVEHSQTLPRWQVQSSWCLDILVIHVVLLTNFDLLLDRCYENIYGILLFERIIHLCLNSQTDTYTWRPCQRHVNGENYRGLTCISVHTWSNSCALAKAICCFTWSISWSLCAELIEDPPGGWLKSIFSLLKDLTITLDNWRKQKWITVLHVLLTKRPLGGVRTTEDRSLEINNMHLKLGHSEHWSDKISALPKCIQNVYWVLAFTIKVKFCISWCSPFRDIGDVCCVVCRPLKGECIDLWTKCHLIQKQATVSKSS